MCAEMSTDPFPITRHNIMTTNNLQRLLELTNKAIFPLLLRNTLVNVVVSTLCELLGKDGQTCVETYKERISI